MPAWDHVGDLLWGPPASDMDRSLDDGGTARPGSRRPAVDRRAGHHARYNVGDRRPTPPMPRSGSRPAAERDTAEDGPPAPIGSWNFPIQRVSDFSGGSSVQRRIGAAMTLGGRPLGDVRRQGIAQLRIERVPLTLGGRGRIVGRRRRLEAFGRQGVSETEHRDGVGGDPGPTFGHEAPDRVDCPEPGSAFKLARRRTARCDR